MRKFCPKLLDSKPLMASPHGEPYTLSTNFGFTLIELLVVIGITVLLVGGGIAAYNNFNQNQILSQAAATLKMDLRDAQNRALSGEKDCSVCGGADGTCGTGSDDKPLDGWYVNFTGSSYRIYGSCGGPPPGQSTFGDVSVNLPSELQFSPLPSPILFKSLTHGTNISGSTTITLRHTASGRTQNVIITSSGEIR